MSAIEWLPFISPFIWILLSLNILAFIPTKERNKELSVNRVLHKISVILFWMIGIGWFFAYITPHIMTPIIYVNILELSKLLLTPALIGFSIVLLCRILQKQCALTLLIETTLKALKPFGIVFIAISPILLEMISKMFSSSEDEEDDEEEKNRQNRDAIHVNWRGDYSGHNHWNKY